MPAWSRATPRPSSPSEICRSRKRFSPRAGSSSSPGSRCEKCRAPSSSASFLVTFAAVVLGLEPWHGVASMPPSLAPTFLAMDLSGAFEISLAVIVLTLLLVTILDTAGTLIGSRARQACSTRRGACRASVRRCSPIPARRRSARLSGPPPPPPISKAPPAWRRGAARGSRPSPSPCCSFSPCSFHRSPILCRLYATAPALLFVACLMATSLGAIHWQDATEYIPALIVALMVPLSFSIATGIGLGFIAYKAPGAQKSRSSKAAHPSPCNPGAPACMEGAARGQFSKVE